MPLSQIQSYVVTLVGTVASLALGLGAFGAGTEQDIVTIGGILVSALFSVLNQLHIGQRLKAGLVPHEAADLRKL